MRVQLDAALAPEDSDNMIHWLTGKLQTVECLGR